MYKIFIVLLFALLSSACQHKKEVSFFDNLSKHCGKSYNGESVFPDDPGEDFAGKVLTMHVKSCTSNEIRVPFAVGDNNSRTWVFTKTDKGLLLKHDHRHDDGTEDEISQYGGYADEKSTAMQNNFAADAHTAKLIPDAKTNVWKLSFDDSGETFTYYLERHSLPRYKAIFKLK